MTIDIKNASQIFFQNSSLEMVFYEAVANSIDAGATTIDIQIKIESLKKPETLVLEIIDNGEGFTDKNADKFSSLLKPENNDHKGLGSRVTTGTNYSINRRIFRFGFRGNKR